MKYIFFGTPRFAEISLRTLCEGGLEPVSVVCNPDKPQGRKKIPTPPAVKVYAEKRGIEVFQPQNKDELTKYFSEKKDFYAVVAAFNMIIPPLVLSHFLEVVGIHPSLLPLYRGPSPIQSAILEEASQTGVSLYLLDEKMDHGPVIASESIPIGDDDTYLSLETKLATLGGALALSSLPTLEKGDVSAQEQNHKKATYTKKFVTEDGYVDLSVDDPEIIFRKIKALYPEPGVYTFIEGKRIKILSAHREDKDIIIDTIVPEGKKERQTRIQLG